MDKEIWRMVPSVPGLMVSNMGRKMAIPYLSQTPSGGIRHVEGVPSPGVVQSTGHCTFLFKERSYKIHRVVCEAFNGPPPFKGAVVMHIDENPRNNRPENLKWGTQKENMNAPGFVDGCRLRGKIRGALPKGDWEVRNGEAHPFAKLTVEQILAIRAAAGRQADIAKQYGIAQASVSRIKNGKAWRRA